MSRYFDSSASDALVRASAIVTASPLTFSVWVKPTALSASTNGVISVGPASGSDSSFYAIRLTDTDITAVARNGGGSQGTASFGAALSIGVWSHVAAVFTSNTSRQVFWNGLGSSVNATSINPTSAGRFVLGATSFNNSNTNFYDGFISYAAVWNAALSPGEIQGLAQGQLPTALRPNSLQAYYTLEQHLLDWRNKYSLTATGTTARTDRPIMRLPPRKTYYSFASAVSSYSYSASGSLVVGGTDAVVPRYLYTASGGLVVGSAAAVVPRYLYTASGNLVVGSAATVLPRYLYTASGNLAVGSAADVRPTYLYTSSGNLTLGGTDTVKPTYLYTGSGSLVVGSAGDTGVRLPYAASGGLVVGSAATVVAGTSYSYTASGGLGCGSSSVVVLRLDYLAAGGLIFGEGADYATSVVIVPRCPVATISFSTPSAVLTVLTPAADVVVVTPEGELSVVTPAADVVVVTPAADLSVCCGC